MWATIWWWTIERILQAYREGASMRAIQRRFGVSHPTLAPWMKKVFRLMSKARAGQRANRPMSGKGPIPFLV